MREFKPPAGIPQRPVRVWGKLAISQNWLFSANAVRQCPGVARRQT